jgi:hypothetical protein
MKKSIGLWAVFVLLLLASLAACGTTATEEAPAAASAASALKITSMVDSETSFTLADLQAMEMMDVETTDKEGNAVQNTGVSLNSLLDQAGVKPDAANLTFVGSDGYEAQVPLADIQACTNCIVALKDDGTLSMVLPDFSGKAQVKGVVEIRAGQ